VFFFEAQMTFTVLWADADDLQANRRNVVMNVANRAGFFRAAFSSGSMNSGATSPALSIFSLLILREIDFHNLVARPDHAEYQIGILGALILVLYIQPQSTNILRGPRQ